jgi:hypothetical protein
MGPEPTFQPCPAARLAPNRGQGLDPILLLPELNQRVAANHPPELVPGHVAPGVSFGQKGRRISPVVHYCPQVDAPSEPQIALVSRKTRLSSADSNSSREQ